MSFSLNPDAMKQALIKLTTAWRRFQRVCETVGGQPREITAKGLHAINTVAIFDLSELSTTPSTPSVNSNPIIKHLTHAVLRNHTTINSINRRLGSALSGYDKILTMMLPYLPTILMALFVPRMLFVSFLHVLPLGANQIFGPARAKKFEAP